MKKRTCYILSFITSLLGAVFLAAFLPEYDFKGTAFFVFFGGVLLVSGAGIYVMCTHQT